MLRWLVPSCRTHASVSCIGLRAAELPCPAGCWLQEHLASLEAAALPEPAVALLLRHLPLSSANAFLIVRQPQPQPQQQQQPEQACSSSGGHSEGTGAGARLGAAASSPGGAEVAQLAAERCIPHEARQQLLAELHATPLFQVGRALLAAACPCCAPCVSSCWAAVVPMPAATRSAAACACRWCAVLANGAVARRASLQRRLPCCCCSNSRSSGACSGPMARQLSTGRA